MNKVVNVNKLTVLYNYLEIFANKINRLVFINRKILNLGNIIYKHFRIYLK